MAVFAFAVMVAYWPGAAGAATTPRSAILAGVLPWLLRDVRLTAAHVAGLAFLLWAIIAIFWTPEKLDGFRALAGYLTLGACFWAGCQLQSLRPVLIGAGLGMAVSSAVAVGQSLGWHPFPVINQNAGLFVNGNFMAEAAALILVGAVAERLWWVIPGLIPAMVLPDARGAALAAATALVAYSGRRGIRVAAIAAALILPALIAAVVVVMGRGHVGPMGALEFLASQAGVKGVGPLGERALIWQSAWDGRTFFGWGTGSFWSVYPHFDLRIGATANPEQAHNEFITILFELGIPGLVAFLLFCATLSGPLDTARLILIALLVESCFAFPLHMPATGFLGMVAAGYAVRSRYLLGDLVGAGRGHGDPRGDDARVRRLYGLARQGGADHALRPSLSGISPAAHTRGKAT